MDAKTTGYNRITNVNNFELSYDDLGEGEIPVIFLHGFPFDKSMWQAQLEFLKSTFRVIAIDIRGFGKSTDEKSELSIDMFANDLKDFMDKLDVEKAVICGLSMGGFIALNALKKFPQRFDALILCDTQCIADTEEVKANRYKTIEEINAKGADDFKDGFIKKVFHSDSLANKKNVVKQVREVVFANSEDVIKNGFVALAERSETCSFLSEITIPTLIICGREDEVTPLEQSQAMNEAIHGSTLKVIDNAGHVSNLEHPDEFNRYLHDFLTTIESFDFEKINGDERMT